MTRPLNFILRLLNLTEGEWGRFLVSWFSRFFYQLGFFLGWTLLLAIFVSHFGVANLPYLLLFYSLLTILGSFLFSFVLEKISSYRLILAASVLTVLLLLAAYFSSAIDENFFALILLAHALLGSQLSILLSNSAEKLFSPLEAERIFPLLESAETIGGIFAGLAAVLGAVYFEVENLIFIWIAAILILASLLVIHHTLKHRDLPRLDFSCRDKFSLKTSLKELKLYPFLRGLALVVALEWALFLLLDYQYTLKLTEASQDLHLTLETQLTHALGTWHILFSFGGLIIQLFFASRLISALGIIRTHLVHPLLSLLLLAFLLLSHSFWPALAFSAVILAKLQNEMTGVLSRASTHNAYYSFPTSSRKIAKQLTEGLARPFGLFLGAVLLLLIKLLLPDYLYLSDDWLLIGLSLCAFCFLFRLHKPFTAISKKILDRPGEDPDKFDAVEILSQPGHHEPTLHLLRKLSSPYESVNLKIQILKTLGRLQNPETIPDLLNSAQDSNPKIQLAALQALAKFKNTHTYFLNEAFARYRIVSVLKDLLSRPLSSHLRHAVIQVFSTLQEPAVVPFLLEMLHADDPKTRSDAIYSMGLFHDASIAYYLEPSLSDPHPRVCASAIISLWQFKRYRLRLLPALISLLDSSDPEVLLSGIYVLGETKSIQEIPRLKALLKHTDAFVRLHAAFALAKMDHVKSHHYIADFLLSEDLTLSLQVEKMLYTLPPKSYGLFQKTLRRKVSLRIAELLKPTSSLSAHALPLSSLEKLRVYYELVDEHAEALRVRFVLERLKINSNLV